MMLTSNIFKTLASRYSNATVASNLHKHLNGCEASVQVAASDAARTLLQRPRRFPIHRAMIALATVDLRLEQALLPDAAA
jgi:hypothetical protein